VHKPDLQLHTARNCILTTFVGGSQPIRFVLSVWPESQLQTTAVKQL